MPQGFIDIDINGVPVRQVQVQSAVHPGKCLRSGMLFQRGTAIGYKDREALTEVQIASLFPNRRPAPITVVLTAEEINPPKPQELILARPTETFVCQCDNQRLSPIEPAIGGVLAAQIAAYSCGWLTPVDQPFMHFHDPEELTRCRNIAHEARERLNSPWHSYDERPFGCEGPIPPCREYFAIARVGEPVAQEIDKTLIQTVFGNTIHPVVSVFLHPLEQRNGRLPPLLGEGIGAHLNEEFLDAFDQFGQWFQALPGFRDFAFVEIGVGEPDPGPIKPRLIVGLTDVGSLVGVASYVLQA